MKSFIFSLLIATVLCIEGVIIPPPDILTNETAKCFLDADKKFLLARTYFEIGKVDNNGVKNLRIAAEAGFDSVLPFVYPSMYVEPKQQIDAVAEALKGMKFKVLWIDIDIKSWREFKNMNIETMKDLVNGYTKAGFNVGVIATRHKWEEAFGNWQLGGYPLIYESLDGKPDFNDFRPFGGFKTPVGKHYVNKNLCGVTAQMVYGR